MEKDEYLALINSSQLLNDINNNKSKIKNKKKPFHKAL